MVGAFDVYAMLAFVARLHDQVSLAGLEEFVTAHIGGVIPADVVTLNRIDLSGTMGGSRLLFDPAIADPVEIAPKFDAYLWQHPLVNDYLITGDPRPRRLSDFVDMRQFVRTDLYREVFAPLRSLHQLAFSITAVPGLLVGVGVNRTKHDFTDAELEVVQSLWGQMPGAIHHVQLREIFDRQLRSPHLAELTPRERETLLLVRAGLTNQQIAVRLVLARRTVDKVLERVYTKLGVSTRTGAIAAIWPPSAS